MEIKQNLAVLYDRIVNEKKIYRKKKALNKTTHKREGKNQMQLFLQRKIKCIDKRRKGD